MILPIGMSRSKQNSDSIGVLLFNLGGPETLEQVRPFLFNLFSDPDIIRLPVRAMQKPLAWIISTSRYRKSRGYYEQIGGGSPLRRITNEQARALEQALSAMGIRARAYVGMRYWNPFIEEALEEMIRDRVSHLVVLPLYPQFSISTTGSSLNRMKEIIKENDHRFERISIIESWQEDERYIASLARTVSDEIAGFPDPASAHIVFSAHSVPVSYIEQGDPYLEHTEQTVRKVMEHIGHRPHSLSFQSKVGPVKWLEPSTDQMLRRLARESVKQVLLVPVSFVSEHIETLYELDILYRDVAEEIGLEHYRRAPALNCREDFIEAIAHLVREKL